eukprot:1195160-Prorocentrum_minimum.AAC.1
MNALVEIRERGFWINNCLPHTSTDTLRSCGCSQCEDALKQLMLQDDFLAQVAAQKAWTDEVAPCSLFRVSHPENSEAGGGEGMRYNFALLKQVEFTGILFQPIPWTREERHGMPKVRPTHLDLLTLASTQSSASLVKTFHCATKTLCLLRFRCPRIVRHNKTALDQQNDRLSPGGSSTDDRLFVKPFDKLSVVSRGDDLSLTVDCEVDCCRQLTAVDRIV